MIRIVLYDFDQSFEKSNPYYRSMLSLKVREKIPSYRTLRSIKDIKYELISSSSSSSNVGTLIYNNILDHYKRDNNVIFSSIQRHAFGILFNNRHVPNISKYDLILFSLNGTGKSWLTCLYCLQQLIVGKVKKVVIVCPILEYCRQYEQMLKTMLGFTQEFSFKVLGGNAITEESTKNLNIIISSLSRLLGYTSRRVINANEVDLVIVDDFEYSKSLNSIQDFKQFFSRFGNARAIVSTEGDKKIIPPVLNNPAIICSAPFNNDDNYYNDIKFA